MCLSPGAERRRGARARHEILLGIVDHAVALQTDGPVTTSNAEYLLNLAIFWLFEVNALFVNLLISIFFMKELQAKI